MSNISTNEEDSSPLNATNSTNLHVTVWGSLHYSLPTLIVVAIVLFLVIVATAFGNFMVVLALFKYRSLRTISNYLIGNLALSDFLLATTILPLSTVSECLGHWVFGQALCNAWLIMDVLYCTASIWNILVISFDRFTATAFPIWYRETRSAKKAAVYIALVWLISCAICLPPVFGWKDLSLSHNYVYDEEQSIYRCNLFETKSYVLYSACGSFYIPFFMTFIFYMAIFIALRDRMLKTRKSRMSTTTTTTAAAAAKTVTETHRKTVGKKRSSSSSSAKNKSHRLQKEYKFEMVNIDDRKDAVDAADESSSRSLFGSDSEREKSLSDVETDVIGGKIAMTSQTTETAGVTHDRPAALDDVVTRDMVSSNGFAQMTSPGVLIDHPVPVPATAEDRNSEGIPPTEARFQPDASHQTAKTTMGNRKATAVAAAAARRTPAEKTAMGRTALAPKTTAARETAKQNRRYEQREMRATIRMSIIVAFFCTMWVGFFTTYVLKSWCGWCQIPRELDAFFFWLGYSNSSVNPILYTIFNDDFRKAFMQIMGCHVIRDFAMATYNRFSLNSP